MVSDLRIFKRLSVKQRGHFSNLPTLFPILKIETSSGGVVFKKRWKTFKYSWRDVKTCVLLLSRAWKGYGRYAGKEIATRTLVIEFSDKTFKIDVSRSFPDFERADELLLEFQTRLQPKEMKVKSRVPAGAKYFWLFSVGFLLLVFMLSQGFSVVLSWVLMVLLLALSSLSVAK